MRMLAYTLRGERTVVRQSREPLRAAGYKLAALRHGTNFRFVARDVTKRWVCREITRPRFAFALELRGGAMEGSVFRARGSAVEEIRSAGASVLRRINLV